MRKKRKALAISINRILVVEKNEKRKENQKKM